MHRELCSQSARSVNKSVSANLQTHLEEWVPRNDAKKALKTLAPGLNDLVRETIGEYLAGEGRYVDSRRLALENVAEGLKV